MIAPQVRFELQYPGREPQEVEVTGSLAVLGRDPSCDIVVSDVKCSRRHAVIEAAADGLAIRDAGSANGLFVNGKRVERVALVEDDVISIGDARLRVLGEGIPGTVVMGLDELGEIEAGTVEAPILETPQPAPARPPLPRIGPPPAPPAGASGPPRTSPKPAGPLVPATDDQGPDTASLPRIPAITPRQEAERARAKVVMPRSIPPAPTRRPPRPTAPPRAITVSLLAVLWVVTLAGAVVGGIALLATQRGATAIASAIACLLVASLAGIMAYGLWARAAWARVLQMVVAAAGVFVCPFTLASVATLAYLMSAAGRRQFAGEPEPAGSRGSDPLFAGIITVTVALGVIVTAAAALIALRTGGPLDDLLGRGRETAAIVRLESMAAAQRAFAAGTCRDVYSDMKGLTEPASAIPGYPPDGPAFLGPELAKPELDGYRFDLTVVGPLTPAECASRGFRHFRYTATPVGGRGRHFMIADDGVVRAASGRPATPADPAR